MTKIELKEYLENYSKTYDIEEDYRNIYNACIDYMNDTQDFSLEYIFENIIDYDLAEEIAKNEIDNGGLIRLYYFLGDANLNNSIFKINGYGNLEDFISYDLDLLIDELLNNLEEV